MGRDIARTFDKLEEVGGAMGREQHLADQGLDINAQAGRGAVQRCTHRPLGPAVWPLALHDTSSCNCVSAADTALNSGRPLNLRHRLTLT